MYNYYEILGLSNTASIAEVKSAFRNLAKLYHPDVNPDGRERFVLILKAYEILSDPQQKYIYDSRIRTGNPQQSRSQSNNATKEKNWKFDERELRRRQYYNEHIRKYEKKSATSEKVEVPQSTYNEYKYILYATPLAVLLFVGIMYVAGDKSSKLKSQTEVSSQAALKPVNLGDAPYSYYFGNTSALVGDSSSLRIKNMSGYDAVICIFSGARFLRCCFLNHGVAATVPQLPLSHLSLRYCTGARFNLDKRVEGCEVSGEFEQSANYYVSKNEFSLSTNNELTLLPGTNQGFKLVLPPEFFNKEL